ncbi:MAG: hypothetical protein N3A66_09350 [Planctomycetota bacterium]|nr:hypothetical protein [Planctomycetota bacterium]
MHSMLLAQRLLTISALLWFLVANGSAGEPPPTQSLQPRHRGSRILASDDLVIEVMDPTSAERYNRGVRFTPVAAVIRAAVGKDEYLANAVEHDPLTAAAGLFAEFDLVTSPPGFDAAKIGEGYMKIGVGILKKGCGNLSLV